MRHYLKLIISAVFVVIAELSVMIEKCWAIQNSWRYMLSSGTSQE